MRRNSIFSGLLVMLVFAGLVALPFAFNQVLKDVSTNEEYVSKLLASLLGLIAAAFAVLLLMRYAQQRRGGTRRFVLDDIANASDLKGADGTPVSLSTLIRERLAHEIRGIQHSIESYDQTDAKQQQAQQKQVCDSYRLLDEVFPLDDGAQNRLATLHQNLPTPDQPPAAAAVGGEASLRGDGSHHSLQRAVLRNLSQLKDIGKIADESRDAMAQSQLSAPQQFAPVMALVQSIFSQPVTRITGHLQSNGNGLTSSRVGLSFEFVAADDQGSDTGPRTLWMNTKASPLAPDADEGNALAAAAYGSWSASGHHADATMGQAPGAVPSSAPLLLVGPAARWLALHILESRLRARSPQHPWIQRVLGRPQHAKRPPSIESQISYLFGALYYTSAGDFPACGAFFRRLAAEHFTAIKDTEETWWAPCKYLADMTSHTLQSLWAPKGLHVPGALRQQDPSLADARKKLLQVARDLYNEALRRAKLPAPGEQQGEEEDVKNRIEIGKATALLRYGDYSTYLEAAGLVRTLVDKDPIRYDSTPPDSAHYLYNLANWHVELIAEISAGWLLGVPNQAGLLDDACYKARYYLTAALIRDESHLWEVARQDDDLRNVCTGEELLLLRKEVDRTLEQYPGLAKLKDDDMKWEIDKIMQVMGWQQPGDWSAARGHITTALAKLTP